MTYFTYFIYTISAMIACLCCSYPSLPRERFVGKEDARRFPSWFSFELGSRLANNQTGGLIVYNFSWLVV